MPFYQSLYPYPQIPPVPINRSPQTLHLRSVLLRPASQRTSVLYYPETHSPWSCLHSPGLSDFQRNSHPAYQQSHDPVSPDHSHISVSPMAYSEKNDCRFSDNIPPKLPASPDWYSLQMPHPRYSPAKENEPSSVHFSEMHTDQLSSLPQTVE